MGFVIGLIAWLALGIITRIYLQLSEDDEEMIGMHKDVHERGSATIKIILFWPIVPLVYFLDWCGSLSIDGFYGWIEERFDNIVTFIRSLSSKE
jgi:hypothetical protein